jgi:hypothetical protein
MKLVRITRLRVFTVDLEAVATSTPQAPRLAVSWIQDGRGLEAIDEAAAQDGERRRLGTMAQHLADSGRIAAVLESGKPVAWQLLRPREQRSFGWLHLLAGTDAVFSFGVYTVRPWRGRRLFGALSRYSADFYLKEGSRRMVSLAECGNTASLRARQRRGDRPVGWILRLRLPKGLTLVMTDSGLDAGIFSKARPFVYRVRDSE